MEKEIEALWRDVFLSGINHGIDAESAARGADDSVFLFAQRFAVPGAYEKALLDRLVNGGFIEAPPTPVTHAPVAPVAPPGVQHNRRR